MKKRIFFVGGELSPTRGVLIMLLATDAVVALRCPMCGKFDTHHISLFSFAGKKTVHVTCACGATKMVIGTHNRVKFWLQLPCVLCETKHLYYYTRNQIWADQAQTLVCADTKVELAFVGNQQKVATLSAGYSQDIASFLDELDPEDYINNPTVMMEVLNSLHDIAEDGYLFCECGNVMIDVDIMPDRLELQCTECGAVGTIPAENEGDLEAIRHAALIELTAKGTDCLDTSGKDSHKGLRKGTNRRWRNHH